jgi:hypothetical protein
MLTLYNRLELFGATGDLGAGDASHLQVVGIRKLVVGVRGYLICVPVVMPGKIKNAANDNQHGYVQDENGRYK